MLLRAGVGKLRMVDFDQVSLSSLNRHCLAVREDVGTSKTACLEKYFRRIMPEATIEAMNTMYSSDAEEEVLSGAPDFVVDAIDNIDTKIELLAACKSRGLRVLAVAGAGQKQTRRGCGSLTLPSRARIH
jgi:tRNA A37 threonylcarbamoyladenosine dehydratase